ncbi:hypothetical protein GCM10010365_75380 [Streptomyces poonensis]|uniref:Ricin B lectin domain-containing protein n=1 Tax=Streptomyces poonensis TaxID=68255 RepID=A0A918UXU3_9ACTN|nr:hypothetical protein GCM10010365_75380 [Streptomyces poonensis]
MDTNAWYVMVDRNSGKAVDVSGASTADGARVSQWTRNDGADQQWHFVDSGNGFYRLEARHSDKVLDVAGASTADGGNVVQYTDWGGVNQQWQPIKLSSGGGGRGSTPTPASGTRTIQSGGKSRSFILRVPVDYDNSHPYRLIFAFHQRAMLDRLRTALIRDRQRDRQREAHP